MCSCFDFLGFFHESFTKCFYIVQQDYHPDGLGGIPQLGVYLKAVEDVSDRGLFLFDEEKLLLEH